MKISIFISIILLCQYSFAQSPLPVDSISGKIMYSEVVRVDSVSKEIIYARAKEWFAIAFKSAKDVIQLDDKDNSTIIGKGLFTVTLMWSEAGVIHLSIKIQARDGRYKYEITDFVHEADPRSSLMSGGNLERESAKGGFLVGMTKGQWRSIKEQTAAKMALVITELKASMATKEKEW